MTDPRERGRRSRRIGRRGENWVEDLFLGMDLVPRDETWDDGEDLNVEFERPDGRWERVLVQVKTSEDMEATGAGTWHVRIRANAVERYRRSAHPVILIAVDLATREMRWDALRDIATAPVGPLSVAIEPVNRLTETDRAAFVARLATLADAQRRTVLPPSLALAQEEQLLQQLDPRFRVRMVADSEHVMTHIGAAGEPVTVQLHGRPSPEGADALEHHLRFGTPATVPWEALAFTGSPLLESLPGAAGAVLEIHDAGIAHELVVGWLDESGTLCPAIEGHALTYTGDAGLELRLQLPDHPIGVVLRGLYVGGEHSGHLTFSLEPWGGKPYAQLPWWDRTLAFLQALSQGRPLAWAPRQYGEVGQPTTYRAPDSVRAFAEQALASLGPLPALVQAVRRTRSALTWRDATIPWPEVRRWKGIARLLNGEAIEAPLPARVTASDASSDGGPYETLYLWELRDLTWLGEVVGPVRLLWRLTHYEPLSERLDDAATWGPTSNSRAHIWLIADDAVVDDALIANFGTAVAALPATPPPSSETAGTQGTTHD